MSYDLFFRVPKGRKPVGLKDFQAYFQHRPGYEVSKKQAWYGNDNTGVYFCFDHADTADEAGAGPGVEETLFARVSFNLNYCRPHIFGLEAEPEVAALIRHFQLEVDDPQTQGMAQGPYSAEGFLKGWNAGNRLAYSTLHPGVDKERPPSLPTSDIERYWRWNAGVERARELAGETQFVAKVMFMLQDGDVRSFAVWPDAIPIVLPETDYILLMRDELAPRSVLRKKKPDQALLARADMKPLLRFGKRKEGPLPSTSFRYEEAPAEVTSFFKNLSPYKDKFQGLAIDKILNRELLG